MAADDGPRIAALAFDGWDTHAMKAARSAGWRNCSVASMARWRNSKAGSASAGAKPSSWSPPSSAAPRASTAPKGTDHGTGTIALLAGGAVKGGRVISDWPGLRIASLYQGRDLAPTTDLRAVMKGLLHDQFGLAERVLAETVFPDSAPVRPMQGLVA